AAGDVGIIWVDSDGYELLGEEYRPLLVTTVEKRMEPAILGVIGADIDGTFEAGNNVGTLENDGVGLSSFHDWDSKVPAELKSEIEDLKAKIISGEIVVESPSSPTGAN
ncbi:BMP family lipoprotein, partial [Pseudoclavibacter helvolus]